jgi:hypothetical protein
MTREQLEEQAECNRAAVAGTLDELKKRLSPGEIVDEVLAYMQGGGNDFINNLGKQVTDNPMPVTLIGAGLAWFLFSKNAVAANAPVPRAYPGNGSAYPRGSAFANSYPASGASYPSDGSYPGNAGSYARSAASDIGDAANSAMNKAGDMASSAAEGVSDAAHAVGDAASRAANAVGGAANAVGDAASNAYHQAAGAASSAYHQAADAASGAYNQAADHLAMARDSAIQVEQKAMAAAKQTMDFMQEQPLILAGIGLALGAAIGAALPSTQLEDDLLGETSDELE